MSVFVGLIITNCIVMGRTGGMAKNVEPIPAFLDGLGAGNGYAIVLFIVAFIREIFGFGQPFGYQVVPTSWYANSANPDGYDNFVLMVAWTTKAEEPSRSNGGQQEFGRRYA